MSTISAIIKAGILAGKTNDQILVDVYKDFPNANTKTASVSWYRSQMKVKAPTKTAVAKATSKVAVTLSPDGLIIPANVEAAATEALKKISDMTVLPTQYTLKGLKKTVGMEGEGYQYTLCRYGVAVCTVSDFATGGPVHFEWLDYKVPKVVIHNRNYKGEPHSYTGTPEEKLFSDLVMTLPDHECSWVEEDGKPVFMQMSTDVYAEELLREYELAKHFKRIIAKKLAYIRDDGKIYTVNRPYTAELAATVLAKNPGARILNIMSEADGVKALKAHG